MTREWRRGDPVPDQYAGMPVTFAWNATALTTMLDVLRQHYPSGYASMVDHVRKAMEGYTPPKPDEPTGLGAVVEAIYDNHFVRVGAAGWVHADDMSGTPQDWQDIAAVRVLSEGVSA